MRSTSRAIGTSADPADSTAKHESCVSPRPNPGGDGRMTHPRAGQPAAPSDLVDVAKLVTAYYTEHPDPAEPAQRVSFGTSGHRGSALSRSFNEDHILA